MQMSVFTIPESEMGFFLKLWVAHLSCVYFASS